MYKLIRRLLGGTWYYYRFTGELPGLCGTMWTRTYMEPHRFYYLVRIEDYARTVKE